MAESQNIMPGGCYHSPTGKAVHGDRPKTTVTFKSEAFNTSVSRDYFINPGCFGDDVLIWLVEELRKSGITTDDKPGQEDFGWYFNYSVDGTRYSFVLGFRPGDDASSGVWIGEVEKHRGLLGSMFGGRHRNIAPAACDVLHKTLSSSPKIHDVRWHDKKTFDRGNEDAWGPGVGTGV